MPVEAEGGRHAPHCTPRDFVDATSLLTHSSRVLGGRGRVALAEREEGVLLLPPAGRRAHRAAAQHQQRRASVCPPPCGDRHPSQSSSQAQQPRENRIRLRILIRVVNSWPRLIDTNADLFTKTRRISNTHAQGPGDSMGKKTASGDHYCGNGSYVPGPGISSV